MGNPMLGDRSALTSRELEVLRMLSEGMSTPTIALELHLSVNTVRNHVQNILGKLEVHSKLEAVSHAIREDLIPPPSSKS
jgi:DNA-binding NarL/FixJ family response regulator